MLTGSSSPELRDPRILEFANQASVPLIVASEDPDDDQASQAKSIALKTWGAPDGVEVFPDLHGSMDGNLGAPLTQEQIDNEYFPWDRTTYLANAGLSLGDRPFLPDANLYSAVRAFLQQLDGLSRDGIGDRMKGTMEKNPYGLRSLWSDLQRLPARSMNAIVTEDEDQRKPIRVASWSLLVRQLLRETFIAPIQGIQKLPLSIQHTILSTLTAATLTISGYGFFHPKVWDDFIDDEEKIHLAGLDANSSAEVFRNPILSIHSSGLKDEAAAAMLTERVMEALFVQSEQKNPPPPPDSLEALTAQLRTADETDSMVLLAPGHLPKDFWNHLNEEESKMIRKHVRCVIFAKNITSIFSDNSVNHRGYYIGHGLVVIDSRLAMTGTFSYQLGELMIHEGAHAMQDNETPEGFEFTTLAGEQHSYELQTAYLKRHLDSASGEPRRAIQESYMQALRALRAGHFLKKHYADYPDKHKIWDTHPGHGIQAAEFLRNGLSLAELKPIEEDNEYADIMYDMMSARIALEEYERIGREELSTGELMEVARAYRDQHYRTGDVLDLLIADQLIGLYLHFHADQHGQDLDYDFDRQLRGEIKDDRFKGGSFVNLRQLQKVLPYESQRVVPQYVNPCTKGGLSLENALEEMIQNPSIVGTLESELAASSARRYKTLKDLSYESYLLYRLGYYYLAIQDFEQAGKHLWDYITLESNWHQDFETHVIMMRFAHYFSAHGYAPPANTTWKEISRRHWKAAQRLDPGSLEIYNKIFAKDPHDGNLHSEKPFSYIGSNTPPKIQRLMCTLAP